MRIKLFALIALSVLSISDLLAQLVISPGAQLTAIGPVKLALVNMDFINNGNLSAGSSSFSFSGTNSSFISGTQPIGFFEIEINKASNQSVILQRNVDVANRTLFTSGFLDLHGFRMDLGTTGHLDGEQESTRVIGPLGGDVQFTVNLNSPTASNPANLGIMITANQNLGKVIVRRGHQQQAGIPGVNRSILRYYEIVPANNTNLAGTIQFKYFDGELNGIHEDSLTFFRSDNSVSWLGIGFNSRDVVANIVQRSGLASFARFTLSAGGDFPLPVSFTLFNARCETGNTVITWKTAQEQNSNHFDVQRSADGLQWTVIGQVPASGNSTIEKQYSFNDDHPAQENYYRVAEYDQDGGAQLTHVLKSSCGVADVLTVSPNPFRDALYININTLHESAVTIRLFDGKGALIKMANVNLLAGSNQVRLDGAPLSGGVYELEVTWDGGRERKVVEVLKH